MTDRNKDRYDVSGLVEAQFEPGSINRVLKNLLGITSKPEMDRTETLALERTVDKVKDIYDEAHQFSLEDIRDIHKLWLCDIYKWAGSYRQVNMSSEGITYATAAQIPKLMDEFGKNVLEKQTPCNFDSTDLITKALAEVHTELILIHPFRDGNGRIARLLSTLMALQANMPLLDFKPMLKDDRKNYYAAIKAGFDRNYEPMEEIFKQVINRTLSGRAKRI
ncbi:MAG: Fic family protein [Deltaproteobacteria bacterium]|nr:Fic family protein [Deltaproteobacteria bacterium]